MGRAISRGTFPTYDVISLFSPAAHIRAQRDSHARRTESPSPSCPPQTPPDTPRIPAAPGPPPPLQPSPGPNTHRAAIDGRLSGGVGWEGPGGAAGGPYHPNRSPISLISPRGERVGCARARESAKRLTAGLMRPIRCTPERCCC